MAASKMVRATSLSALMALSLGLQAENFTKVFYSGYFTGFIPTKDLEGATFFVAGGQGIGVKLNHGGYVSGSIITQETEDLGVDFNLADYPLYLYGHKPTDDLAPEVAEPFNNTLEILKINLKDPVFDTVDIVDATVYTACSHRCEAIVVQDQQNEQILHLTSDGLSQVDLLALIKGDINAAK